MNTFDQDKYDKAKEAAHSYFQKNKKIQSPALGTVRLTPEGLLHLVYNDKHHKSKRDWKNQVKRFHLVTHIRRIIEGMSFYQEYQERYQSVQVKRHKHKEIQTKLVKHWGFVAVLDDRIRVKLILRKVGDGAIHFWSIIPIWKTRHYKNIRFVDLATGDMGVD